MKKNIILNVTEKEVKMNDVMKIYTSIHFENVGNIEQTIEKLNFLPVNGLLVDASFDEEQINKIRKIASILHPEIIIQKVNFDTPTEYETIVGKVRTELFRRKMSGYNFEDNPNLNNPFLNIDKTNVFNRNNEA